MTRLKKGDICPLCGEPIMTSDPFTLGYLSAWADLTSSPETESPADDSGEDFPFAYSACNERGKVALRAQHEAKSPCAACSYGGKHLDAPPCTNCPAYPKEAENEPLTLKELREMDGQPVYVVAKEGSGWAVVDWHGVNKSWMYFSKTGTAEGMSAKAVFAHDYGTGWIAYSHPPKGAGE